MVEKCGEKVKKNLDANQNFSLKEVGEICVVLGAFYGLLLSQKLCPGIINGTLQDNASWKMIARFVMGCVFVVAIFFTMLKFVESAKIENSYALLVFRGIIPYTLIGMSLFLFADILSQKLGLLEMQTKNPDHGEKGANQCGDEDESANLLEIETANCDFPEAPDHDV